MSDSRAYVSPAIKAARLATMRHHVQFGPLELARQALALGHVTRQEFRQALKDYPQAESKESK